MLDDEVRAVLAAIADAVRLRPESACASTVMSRLARGLRWNSWKAPSTHGWSTS